MKTDKLLNFVLVCFCIAILGFVIVSAQWYDNYMAEQGEIDQEQRELIY